MSKTMNIGFTGTRKGMTREQRLAVRKLLSELEPEEVHHGDCLGADKEFHDEAKAFTKAWVVVHPGLVNTQRAFCLGDEARAAKPFLQRNHDIANAVDLLVATPGQQYEVLRSGTWATIRYAKKTGVPLVIVWPDGSQEETRPTKV